MKLQEARQLIQNTFENTFDKGRFNLFLKNLLHESYEERTNIQTGGQVPQAFSDIVRKMERVGKYEDDEGNIIDLLIVEIKNEHSIERARTAQRNFISRYLNGSRGEFKDAALVAFYSEGSPDWRFSLIKMQYSIEKKKDELTPAKRFSFLVGADEKSHTAQNQLANLLLSDSAPGLAEIESSFNIETVTNEFFEKYRDLFLSLNEHIEKEIKKSKELRDELVSKNIDAASFTKKLLGQIVFLYFLQKKGWLGVPKNENWGKGDKKFLRNLLEEAKKQKKKFFADYLVYLFYEALATEHRGGSDSSFYPRLNSRIPFLNGGLFEADYEWKKISINLPNDLFTNDEMSDEGDTGTGVLDVFDRYNFTVKEDEPLEKEVAIDPEMLGKVFENLLEVKDRKSKGAFYTPREVVTFMCQEAIINYLDISVNNDAESYSKLGEKELNMFGNKERGGQLSLESANGKMTKVLRKDLEKFIREGSSALDNDALVEEKGVETRDLFYKIPESIRNNAKELDKALADVRICDPAIGSGAFPVGMMNEIVRAREILKVFIKGTKAEKNTLYELKRHAIQECIYGVDIDHSAIDIAKLRLWLSLVVDEEDFYKIKPLPNLDYKIVQGNSLVGFPSTLMMNNVAQKELENYKEEFFSETDHEKKIKLRKKIEKAKDLLIESAKDYISYSVEFDFNLYFSEVFHKNGGFDIIIGNPPYISYYSNTGSSLSKAEKQYYVTNYSSVIKENDRINSMNLFSEKAISLLKDNGFVTFIVNKTFAVLPSYFEIRKYFLNNTRISYIVYGLDPFDAIVDCLIFGCRKESNINNSYLIKWYEGNIEIYDPVHVDNFLNNKKLEFHYTKNNILIRKIEKCKGKMENILLINRGINIGGYSEYFLSDEKDNSDYYKYLTSIKSLRRYNYEWNKDCDCYFKFDSKLEIKLRKKGATIVLGNPERYLGRKLFIPESAQSLQASYVAERIYSAYGIMVGTQVQSKYNIKYACALLNSKLITFYAEEKEILRKGAKATPHIGVKGLNSIPIHLLQEKEQEPLINMVDKILSAKKENPNANTRMWERQIDVMVYHLYKLSYEEALIVDPELTEEEFERYRG